MSTQTPHGGVSEDKRPGPAGHERHAHIACEHTAGQTHMWNRVDKSYRGRSSGVSQAIVTRTTLFGYPIIRLRHRSIAHCNTSRKSAEEGQWGNSSLIG